MFIEVTSTSNSKILVNINEVQDIIKSTIYFKTKGDFINCKETYDEIKNKLAQAGFVL